MPIPATGGQLRTKIEDMQIGDCIKSCYTTGVMGTNIELIDKGYPEYPLTGSPWATAPNGSFYFIKADKGLLIADRVIFHTVSWDALNSNDLTQGRLNMVKDHTGIIRSLGGGNSYAAMANIVPKMTSGTAPSGVVGAGNEGAGYEAWKAFDRTLSWYSDGGVAKGVGFLSYDFQAEKEIAAYAITARSDKGMGVHAPKDWSFEGYDANLSQWAVLDKQSGVVFSDGQKKVFNLNKKVKHSIYRLNITATGSGVHINIGELEMFDSTPVISSATDQGLGAWPADNEWDQYIVRKDYGTGSGRDDVWHFTNCATWTQDTGLDNSSYRINRNMKSGNKMYNRPSSEATTGMGFRPAFEYQEAP